MDKLTKSERRKYNKLRKKIARQKSIVAKRNARRRTIKRKAERFLLVLCIVVLILTFMKLLVDYRNNTKVYVDTQSSEVAESTLGRYYVPKVFAGVTSDLAVNLDEYEEIEVNIEQTEVPETSTPAPEPTSYIELSDDDKYMIASLVYLEGRGESIECQKAIASVVINRYTTGEYHSISDVIYATNQFTPARYVSSTCPDQTQIDVVNEVCESGVTIPEYVTYFRAGHYHRFNGQIPYTQLSSTYFSYDRDVYNQVMGIQ